APLRVSRGVAVGMTRWQVGVLRRMESVRGAWRERLARLRPVEAIYEALRLETTLWPITKADVCPPERNSSIIDIVNVRMCRLIGQPYARFGMEDASRRYLAQLDRLDPSRASCDAEVEEVSIAALKEHMPLWNRTGDLLDYGGEYSLRSAERLALDIEMT